MSASNTLSSLTNAKPLEVNFFDTVAKNVIIINVYETIQYLYKVTRQFFINSPEPIFILIWRMLILAPDYHFAPLISVARFQVSRVERTRARNPPWRIMLRSRPL